MQTTIKLAAARIKRLVGQIERDCPPDEGVPPSYIVTDIPPAIDDGGEYGDPFEDRRPEFVKQANAELRGYTSLGRLDRQ